MSREANGYILSSALLAFGLANDRLIGGVVLVGSVIGIVLYALLVFYAWQITLRVTAFLGIALIFAILAWIGYTMATTRPPQPMAEVPEVKTEQKPDSAEQKT